MKNIVVLQGSPHPNGNTATLTKAFLKGLKRGRRLNVAIFEAYGIKAAPLLQDAYRGLKKPRTDEGDAVVAAMMAADLIVLATPIYYWGMAGQLKVLWERLHAEDSALLKGKQLAIIATGGGEDKADSGANLVEQQFRNVCAYAKMKFKGLIFASSEPAPVSKNKKALLLAEKAGARIR